jgi:hypothetical protein
MIECEICHTFHVASLDEHTSDSMVVLGAAHRALPGCGACVGERSIYLGFCACHYRDQGSVVILAF